MRNKESVITRDKTLDRLRGFAMLWVIVVHVLYWSQYFSSEFFNLFKSFCLFEMPLFFFITGASNSFSSSSGYFRFVYKRFCRVLIPYWVFAAICAVLSIIKYHAVDMDIIKILASWALPVEQQISSIPRIKWALWFIPVYLCIIMLIPSLKRMKQSRWRFVFGLILLAVFAGTCLLHIGWVQNVAFYSLWTYIGLFYPEIKAGLEQKYAQKYLWSMLLLGGISICTLHFFAKQSLDMQRNKFPPNMMFLAFSSLAMPLILLCMPRLDKILARIQSCKFIGKIFNLFSTRSMTIFLYQPFAFNLTIPIANALIPGSSTIATVGKALLCLATTILTCAGFAVIFGRAEKIGTNPHKNGNRKRSSEHRKSKI